MASSDSNLPPAMILCGGQGTRIRDVAEILPKPMVTIGPHPIVWHIMKTYAAFGVKRFILCLGYKREAFIDYFLNYHARATDITVKLGQEPNVTYHGNHGQEDWEVTLADTGENTMTGGRIAKAVKYLRPSDEHFFLTYGDAVAAIDIQNLYDFHLAGKKDLTVTAVHPTGRFGEMKLSGNDVTRFHEKPQTEEGFINGGFMVLRKAFCQQHLPPGSNLAFEEQPMAEACKTGQMQAFRHDGFWQCMDTAREHNMLNELWENGSAPWTEAW